eukprot:EC118620.1.p1 GENE.EC118620.1~~EC118620.1.p1  ORF type:complete len:105 (+),score=21.94 EC118620.1:113-427(+)
MATFFAAAQPSFFAAPKPFTNPALPGPFGVQNQPIPANFSLPNVFQSVEVVVQPGESVQSALKRFKRMVTKAGILVEAKRHRYFETTQEKKKRKAMNARRSSRY